MPEFSGEYIYLAIFYPFHFFSFKGNPDSLMSKLFPFYKCVDYIVWLLMPNQLK